MEISTFSENIVSVSFERNGETVELKVNIDAIVPDYYDQLEERLAPLNKRITDLQEKYTTLQEELKKAEKAKKKVTLPSILPLEKQLQEIQREAWAEKLTCPVKLPDGTYTQLLKGWSVVEQGKPLEPTKENLIRLPPQAVEELWERSIRQVTTVKKRVDLEIAETSGTTQDSSQGLRVVGQSG